MAALNDVIYLTFTGADREVSVAIRTDRLHELLDNLTKLVNSTLGVLHRSQPSGPRPAHFQLVASPQKGSLIITLILVADQTIDWNTAARQLPKIVPVVGVLADFCEVGGAAYLLSRVLFGKNGVVARNTLKGRGKGRTKEERALAVLADELDLQLGPDPMKRLSAAAQACAEVVQIEVANDNGPVPLIGQANRTRVGLIGRRGGLGVREPFKPGATTLNIPAFKRHSIRVKHAGQSSRAFVATIDRSRLILVVWRSSEDPPSEAIEVQFQHIADLDEVRPEEPVPPEFENVTAAIAVTQWRPTWRQ